MHLLFACALAGANQSSPILMTPLRLILLFSILAPLLRAAETAPHWIWYDDARTNGTFVKEIPCASVPAKVEISGVADYCHIEILVNGKRLAKIRPYESRFRVECAELFEVGKNRIEVIASSNEGPSAFYLQVATKQSSGDTDSVVTGGAWREKGGNRVIDRGEVDPRFWDAAHDRVQVSILDDYEQWKRAKGSGGSTAVANFQLQPGFEIELIRSARTNEGSWISMAFDQSGRIIVAKERQGLLRLSLDGKKVTQVETINESLREVRGLLVKNGDVFANTKSRVGGSSKNGGGLFRLRDTNGDGTFDEEKLLGEHTATGGHGRNDLALGPDGKIYMIHGDSVAVPKKHKDLTPPVPDHLPGDELPNGHVIRTDVDGKHWELVCKGLRNPFGIDFNADGEMFTYDADAEFDMGAPWYRPTRVRHLVAGADYGWRRVTGSWPPYYPDHADEPPPTLDIGKGSPTAVKFGTRSKFPAKYRNALFVLDWTYGRILAVHMTPRGASYAGRSEVFLRGQPANVTDLGFGPDGAMYFVTGGRQTQSGLYRVRYVGKNAEPKPSAQESARIAFGREQRAARHQLERGRSGKIGGPQVLRHLGSADPWLRYSARLNLEFAGADVMRSIVESPNHAVRLAAGIGLARHGAVAEIVAVRKGTRVEWDSLATREKLEVLRAHELVIGAAPKPAPAPMARELKRLADQVAYSQRFPDSDDLVNFELARMMALVKSKSAVPKILKQLTATADEQTRMHYLYQLREMKVGWSTDLRAQYFAALRQTKAHRAGRGMPQFIDQITKDALAAMEPGERQVYEKLATKKSGFSELRAEYQKAIAGRSFVREWKMSDLGGLIEKAPVGGEAERGRQAYLAASCALCHQLGATGRIFGPDLTSVAQRFSRRDLLESILDPSKIVAEKYRNTTVVTKTGDRHTGRILYQGDYRKPVLQISTNPLDPSAIVAVQKELVDSREDSLVSAMPEGLLNLLSRAEIGELLMFIESGGRADHPVYRR
jgi:putative heme-binding domain-containing protein